MGALLGSKALYPQKPPHVSSQNGLCDGVRGARPPGKPPDTREGPREGPLSGSFLEATPGFEPGVKALQASALPLGHVAASYDKGRPREWPAREDGGADNGVRTRDPHLGKVVLYQLSHVRVTGDHDTRPGGGAQDPKSFSPVEKTFDSANGSCILTAC